MKLAHGTRARPFALGNRNSVLNRLEAMPCKALERADGAFSPCSVCVDSGYMAEPVLFEVGSRSAASLGSASHIFAAAVRPKHLDAGGNTHLTIVPVQELTLAHVISPGLAALNMPAAAISNAGFELVPRKLVR